MSAQQSIAHYRILAKLGEGGMGAVYRATDTKLNRDVAVKVLPEAFARDADRMARFQREAQVLASLNHPNIAAIYGVEERALILEIVPGPTVADRIAQGPIPIEEALRIAGQIAEALEYAHEQGVVHRDLKPANIKVTPEGRVKVLDFGLAKAISSEAGAVNSANSPTLTMRGTGEGVILGTAAYMSPEQARGQAVDGRTDIWAFGVVLYEMVTGRPPFAGPTVSDTLATLLKTEPDLSEIPAQTRPIVERCLRKDPRRRWRSIGDVRMLLEEGLPAAPAQAAGGSSLPWVLAATAILALLIVSGVLWRATRPEDHPLTQLSVDLGPEAAPGFNLTAAISPDGRRLVFPARGPDGKQQLATRLLDQAQPTLLPGTENGRDPFFSPDGQWIGFFVGFQLKKISVQGGAPVTLANCSGPPQGGSWSEDGSIVAAMGIAVPLSRIQAGGGPPQPITKLAPGEVSHRWPQVLPGGSSVLFTASPALNMQDSAKIEIISLKTGQVKTLQRNGYYGRYLPGGRLVYVQQGRLFGVGFDPARREARGEPIPLLEDVAANSSTGGGQFDFAAAAGTFVYAAGKPAKAAWQVSWLDSSGKSQSLLATPGLYSVPRLSPDGRKLAFVGDNSDIYVHDLERDTTTRLTFTGHANLPVWAPDGKHLVFHYASDSFAFRWMRSDGAGEPQRLEAASASYPWSLSPDGRRLAYFERNPDTDYDLWTLPLDISDPDHPKAGKPELFLRTPADESIPRFSADGRWIAYRSNESGIGEIYVRPFPVSEGKWQISSGGGLYALWSRSGRELFYETSDNRIMVVDYTVEGGSFIPGKPRPWSDRTLFYPGAANLDLAPDGKRFAVLALPDEPGAKGSVHVLMLLNFFDELKRRIP